MKILVLTVTLLLMVATTIEAAKKQRQWQTGTLDTDGYSQYVGSTVSDAGIFGTSVRANYVGVHTYVIQVGEYVYIAKQLLRWRWSKYVDLVVNAPVQVAIEKGKMYIPFADGKEVEAMIVKTILKK